MMITNLYKTLRIIVLLLIFLNTSEDIRATHIIGGDITYKNLGGNQFEITLTLRRDCALGQVGFDNPASIGLYSGANNVFFREIRVPFVASDTVGNTLIASCGFQGSNVCVQTTTYKTIQTLPLIPGGYILAYQRCCRNSSLNNVINPLESGSTEWIEISEKALIEGNSSPAFIRWPDVYICANQPLIFDHSASDIDGDSLVYKICTPFDGGTIQFPQPQPPASPPYNLIQWKSPYGPNDMMGGSPLVIDPKTGIITANPNLVGQFLVGICVEEYRNGVLISTVRRDFQYNVRVCNIPLVAEFEAKVNNPCDSLSYVFTNITKDATSFEWNFNFPSTESKYISTQENPVFKFDQPGKYMVRLLVRSSTGACDATVLREINVKSGGNFPPLNLAVTQLSVCPNERVRLLFNNDSKNAYNWSPTAGLDLSDPANPIFLGLSTSTYMVTVTNANNCTSTGTVMITVKPKTEPLIISGNRNVCERVSLSVTGGNNKYEWSSTSTFSQIISNTAVLERAIAEASAKYYVRSVGADCGDVIDSVTVLNQKVNISFPSTVIVCSGSERDIVINNLNAVHILNITSTDPHIVSITGNTIKVKNLPSDGSSFTLNAKVINQFNCSQDISILFTIIYPVVISGDKNLCGDKVTLTASGGNGTFQWSSTGDFAQIIANTAKLDVTLKSVSEKFYVRHTATECTEFKDSIIITNQNIKISPIGPLSICSSTTKDVVVENLNPAHNLSFSTDDPHIVSIIGNVIKVKSLPTDGASFTLKTKVTNQFNCIQDISILFTIIYPVVISGDKNLCGDKVTLMASGGNGTFQWSSTGDFAQIIANTAKLDVTLKSVSEKFYVRHTATECTEFKDSIIITNQNIKITPIGPLTICSNTTKDVVVENLNPAHNLTFSTDDPHIVSIIGNVIKVKNLETDGASFTLKTKVTNQFNCTQDISIVFTIIYPVVISGDKNICGDKVKLIASGGNGRFEWSSTRDFTQILGSSALLETTMKSKTETFYARSPGSDCPNNLDSITVTNQSVSISVPVGGNICKRSTKEIIITNLNADHNLIYTWNDPHIVSFNGNTIKVTTLDSDGSSFEVKGSVTNQFNCTQPISIKFKVKDQKPVAFAAQLQSCRDFTMCFTINGTYEGNLIWNFGSGLAIDNSNQINPCFKYDKAGKYKVKLTNTESECPFSLVESEITVPDIGDSIVTVNIKQDVCKSNDVCFSISGKYIGNLKWEFGDPTSSSNTSTLSEPCHNFVAPGNYVVSLKNENALCPFKEVKTSVIITPKFALNPIANQTVCEGQNVTFNATSNDPGATYSWFDATGKLLGSAPTLSVNPMNIMSIKVKALSTKGCQDSLTVSVNIFKFNYTIELPQTICPKTEYQAKLVIANPENYTFSWSPADVVVNGGSTSQPILLAVIGKTVKVEITNKATGCKETKEITPAIKSPLVFNFSGTLCNNSPSTLTLNITNPNDYTYLWSPATAIVSGGTTNTPVVRVTAGQQLKVLVTNKATGCFEELTYNPQVLPPLTVTFTEPNIEIKQGAKTDIFVRNPITGATYTWNTGDRGTTIKVGPLTTTTYTVTATDSNGCTGSGQITVNVRVIPCTDKDEYLPNAFTPNGDGKNDVLLVKSTVITEMEFVIYNRWGQEMFSTTNINEGWDGTFQGNQMSPDVYAYYIKGTCLSGDKFIKKGNVSLLK